jgi:hypothetical protein
MKTRPKKSPGHIDPVVLEGRLVRLEVMLIVNLAFSGLKLFIGG